MKRETADVRERESECLVKSERPIYPRVASDRYNHSMTGPVESVSAHVSGWRIRYAGTDSVEYAHAKFCDELSVLPQSFGTIVR
jgi:hypothetical protein